MSTEPMDNWNRQMAMQSALPQHSEAGVEVPDALPEMPLDERDFARVAAARDWDDAMRKVRDFKPEVDPRPKVDPFADAGPGQAQQQVSTNVRAANTWLSMIGGKR